MARQPVFGLSQGFPAQPEPMNPTLDGAEDETSLFKHFQVLRDRRLRRAVAPAKIAGASRLAARQHVNHRSPRAV